MAHTVFYRADLSSSTWLQRVVLGVLRTLLAAAGVGLFSFRIKVGTFI